MKYTFYKKVKMDENGIKEPVNYVGVHPFAWYNHPEQPDFGFTEIELDLPDDIETEEKLKDYLYNESHMRPFSQEWFNQLNWVLKGAKWLRDKIKDQLK